MARKKAKELDPSETGEALLEALKDHIAALTGPADDAGEPADDDDDDDNEPADDEGKGKGKGKGKVKGKKAKSDDDELDFDELTTKFTKFSKSEGKSAAIKLLTKFKVEALSELEEDQYADFAEAIEDAS